MRSARAYGVIAAATATLLGGIGCAASSEDSSADSEVVSSEGEGFENDPAHVGAPAPASTLGKDYVALSANAKRDALFSIVSSGEYCPGKAYDAADCAMPHGRSFSFKSLPSLFSLKTTFDTVSDEMPEGRRKLLRPAGIVATFTFEASYPDTPEPGIGRKGPYTGLLAPGRGPIAGVMRLSDNGVRSFNPAVALKFFVDGKPSVNTLAAISMDGQGDDHNFFARPITSHLEPPSGIGAKIIWALFGLTKSDPSLIELDNLAATSADGTAVASEQVRAPFELYYVAHGDLGARFSSQAHEYRADLHSLDAGTVVYDVLARASSSDAKDSREKIGEIRLTSRPVATRGGDERLFFQHNRGSSR
jgi:hypothetical protein